MDYVHILSIKIIILKGNIHLKSILYTEYDEEEKHCLWGKNKHAREK